jgi:TPR repeat protein
MHSLRVYGEVNYNKSIQYITLAAIQGNEEAQCILGEYIMDEMVESEEPLYRSIYWFEKAAKRGFRRAQYRLSWLLINRSYDLYDYLQVPKCSPMPLVLFWIRQAISDGGEKEWQDYHDLLDAAQKEGCVMCNNSIQIGCHICNAVFFCRKSCQETLNELGHDDEC